MLLSSAHVCCPIEPYSPSLLFGLLDLSNSLPLPPSRLIKCLHPSERVPRNACTISSSVKYWRSHLPSLLYFPPEHPSCFNTMHILFPVSSQENINSMKEGTSTSFVPLLVSRIMLHA